MAAGTTRLTFAVTEEMEPLLDRVKKNLFYNRTQSDMIRELLTAGLDSLGGRGAEGTPAHAETEDRIPGESSRKTAF